MFTAQSNVVELISIELSFRRKMEVYRDKAQHMSGFTSLFRNKTSSIFCSRFFVIFVIQLTQVQSDVIKVQKEK